MIKLPKMTWLQLIVIIGAIALCWLGSTLLAHAATNLPLSCKAALVNGVCAETSYQFVPGKAGLTVATPATGWRLWESIGAAEQVRACPADITPGTACTQNRVSIAKSLAAAEAVTVGNMTIRVTWVAPTTGVQDGKTVTLQVGDILGYQIAWVPKAGGRGGEIAVPAGATSHTFSIPAQGVSISMSVQGRDSWGPSSESLAADPLAPKPIVPNPVTGFKVEVIQ